MTRTERRKASLQALHSDPAPVLLDAQHVAAHLGVCYDTATKYMRSGQLPTVTLGARRFVPMVALERWLMSVSIPQAS